MKQKIYHTQYGEQEPYVYYPYERLCYNRKRISSCRIILNAVKDL